MNNYVETKKKLDKIRDKYGCKGEVLFRSALQCVLDYGMSDMLDDWCYQHRIDEVNERHDEAEAEGKTLWITRDFELAILECAREIAKVEAYDLLVYIQKEVWLSNDGGIDYQRAIELLKKCMCQIEADESYDNAETLNVLQGLSFTDDELEVFGFGYLIEESEEE